jgi:fructose-1,6-bisphosphatase/inositol monophosphatase family enzyme
MLKIITRKNTRDKLLNYISALMIDANKLVILKYYKDLESRHISTKASEDDFVTIADKESEEFIVRKLLGFLNINHYIGEETSYLNKNEYKSKKYQSLTWVIDPIDGTKNYIKGKKEFCSMISLISNAVPIATFIFYPFKRLTCIRF